MEPPKHHGIGVYAGQAVRVPRVGAGRTPDCLQHWCVNRPVAPESVQGSSMHAWQTTEQALPGRHTLCGRELASGAYLQTLFRPGLVKNGHL